MSDETLEHSMEVMRNVLPLMSQHGLPLRQEIMLFCTTTFPPGIRPCVMLLIGISKLRMK